MVIIPICLSQFICIRDYCSLPDQICKHRHTAGFLLLLFSLASSPLLNILKWHWLTIPWTEEPGELQSMGSLRVRHDWATSLWLFTFMHWRRKWQPTPVFLPGESQGWGSLVGCRLWDRTESDTTQQQQQQQTPRYRKQLFIEATWTHTEFSIRGIILIVQ